jgi:hypothetical protein
LVVSTNRKHRHPKRGRSNVLETQVGEIELGFANAMLQLDAGDRNGRFPEAFEPSIAVILDLMLRWSYSIRLFRYFVDRNVVCLGSNSSVFLSHTAR